LVHRLQELVHRQDRAQLTAWPGFTFTYFKRTAAFDAASHSFGPGAGIASRRARKPVDQRREPALDL
jgi:hypothetical protein